jgi:hypothetical protein
MISDAVAEPTFRPTRSYTTLRDVTAKRVSVSRPAPKLGGYRELIDEWLIAAVDAPQERLACPTAFLSEPLSRNALNLRFGRDIPSDSEPSSCRYTTPRDVTHSSRLMRKLRRRSRSSVSKVAPPARWRRNGDHL